MRRLALALLLLSTSTLFAQTKKYALLVGVNKYQHAELNKPEPLQFAEADVRGLKDLLEKSGYTVTLLTGEKATLSNIRDGISELRKKGSGSAMVLAAFAGHGIQPEDSKDAYFCPYDADQAVFDRDGKKVADWDLKKTMLPLTEVIVNLKASGADSKAILVDACRNDPKTGRGRGFGTEFNVGDLPDNLALMLSCSKGERAWEDKTWDHGAFFHHVLKGMREGKGAVEGHVTANSLAAYVSRAVRTDVPLIIKGGATQRPHSIINGDVDFLIDPSALPMPVKPEPKAVATLKFLDTIELAARNGDEPDFTKDTKRLQIDLFRYEPLDAILAISQSGSISITKAPAEKLAKAGEPKWAYGVMLRARKADEADFTKDTRRFGVEAYKGILPKKILLISETGGIAWVDGENVLKEPTGPKWSHGSLLRSRQSEDEEFTAKTKKFGLEVFQDPHSEKAIYICESGELAVGSKHSAKEEILAPSGLAGVFVRTRIAGERVIAKDRKKMGIEIFKDNNTGELIYISHAGSLASAPYPRVFPLAKDEDPKWKDGFSVTLRPGKAAAKPFQFGVELYEDQNTGYHLFVTETGSIALLAD